MNQRRAIGGVPVEPLRPATPLQTHPDPSPVQWGNWVRIPALAVGMPAPPPQPVLEHLAPKPATYSLTLESVPAGNVFTVMYGVGGTFRTTNVPQGTYVVHGQIIRVQVTPTLLTQSVASVFLAPGQGAPNIP